MNLAVDLVAPHPDAPTAPLTSPSTSPSTSRLAELGARVAPLTLARERMLPVDDTFAGLFAEGGLVRGRTLACQGPAATSTALALVAPAIRAGGWLAMIDLPTIGLDAAGESGIPLERIVAIGTGGEPGRSSRWPDVVAAAADGFEVLLVRVPADLSASAVRKLGVRLRQRDVVTIVLGDPGGFACDGTLLTDAVQWSGLGDGHGHLRERRVTVQATGRRMPGRRRCHLALPAAVPASLHSVG
jgi:hypothetical protein